jgi:hypothetical protein
MGLDLGYVQVKAVEQDWSCIFPSLVKRRSEVLITGLQDSEGYVVTGQECTWNVGAKGSYDFKAERLQAANDIPKLLAVLGLYHDATARSTIDLMVSGLPVDDFKVTDYRNNFTERLQQDFHFGFEGREKFVKVTKSIILPQSAGAFFDFILNEEGEENESNIALASEDVLILDAGGKSTDGCIMEGAKFSQDSFTIWHGVWEVQNELRKLIAKKFHYAMPHYKMDDVLRSGVAKIGAKLEPVEDLCKIAVETIFPALISELSLYVPDFRRFAALLLCGGGSNVFYDYLSELVGIPVLSLDNPEYSNANGYRKYGLLKIQEGLI